MEKTNIFVNKAKLKHRERYDYSKVYFINNKTKIIINCHKHGDFSQTPNSHLNGSGCPKCGYIFSSGKLRKDNDRFIYEANLIHNNRYIYKENYISALTKIKITCHKHGDFSQKPNDHLNGVGCPKCGFEDSSKKRTKSCFEFEIDANLEHGNKYIYHNDYVGDGSKIIITCSKHGDFSQTPTTHLQGTGCPACKESKGENEIRKYLTNLGVKFISQHKFDNCKYKYRLPFDFYLPELNTCVEYNGVQHYESIMFFGGEDGFKERQTKDKIKLDYCKNNNVKLEIIKYCDNVAEKLNYITNK